jgi:hypothetical protein
VKNSSTPLYLFVIAVLVVLLLLQRGCNTGLRQPQEPTVVTVVDTQYITKTVQRPVYKPGQPVVVTLPGDTLIFTEPVDTFAILKDHYSTRVYNDTIPVDSIGFVYLQDSIRENQIQARKFKANYTIPIITSTTTITLPPPPPKTQVFAGVDAGFNKTAPVSYAGPTIALKTKKDALYTVGVGYAVEQGMTVRGSMLWKIKLK